jgi:transcriptional regulator with XRE-family HTH domain
MQDIKSNIAKNITELRILNNMTQMELGEKLNYSDKTISKWERGESTPDISTLSEIADLFSVSLDFLVKSKNIEENATPKVRNEGKYNRRVISYISESVAWIVAIFAFIITTLITKQTTFQWLYFIYALPIVIIVKLVFNTLWFNPRHNYLIVSALMWSVIAAVHITFMYFAVDVSLIYILGVAGQIVIILWSFINKPKIK